MPALPRCARPGFLLLVAALLAGGCARGPKREAASLAWLTGCWEGKAEGGVMDERWGRPAGGTVQGTNRIVKGDRTLHTEYLLVRQTDDGLLLTVHPEGQPAVSFRLQQLGQSDASFVNAAHDFPQRILYHRRGGTLSVRAEGEVDGHRKELRYKLKRTGCE